MSHHIVRRLTALARNGVLTHFLSLSAQDIWMRFGHAIQESVLRNYVSTMDFDADAVFGVYDGGLVPVGVAHMAIAGDSAEVGLSVLARARKQGIGAAMLEQAIRHGKSLGLKKITVLCLQENSGMRRLAEKFFMETTSEGREVEADLELLQSPPDAVGQPSPGTVPPVP